MIMILYIAEKPSLGRAIAQALPGAEQRGDGFIKLANGDYVSWCIGHLLEQAEPDAYDPSYKKWQLEHLPITPEQWLLTAKTKTKKQLTVLRKLVKQADQIVHAGDPDREGQLLVDQVISHLGVKGQKLSGVSRLLINDLTPSAVKKSLKALRANSEFIPLSTSALARSRADWLYGLNMTRAYTIQGQRGGYQGVLSVGRVQTPILGLVVKRDQEIANFVTKPFFEVMAVIDCPGGLTFEAKWQPSEACAAYQDQEGRVIFRRLAENVVARTSNQPALVTKLSSNAKQSAVPLPYNLSSLQIDSAKRFSLSAQAVLDCCQSLYEKHQLITYPRSDSRYLPTEHFKQAKDVVKAIASNDSSLANAVQGADLSLKSRAWNNSKVDAHHAIIPTAKVANTKGLSGNEFKVYQLISTQYLCQFYPPYRYQEQQVELVIAGGLFSANAKKTLDQGWKVLLPKHSDQTQTLPPFNKGDTLHCQSSRVVEKETSPPKAFTDATLLGAMTGIARFVTDKEIKKVLKETDGLGTEATRASIIELLFKRQFLIRQGKDIKATAAGIALIGALPNEATTPDMTALWEANLNQIAQSQLSYQQFMMPLSQNLETLIAQAKQLDPARFAGIKSSKPAFKRKGGGRSKKYTKRAK
jgi:DNA topoisomerase-3